MTGAMSGPTPSTATCSSTTHRRRASSRTRRTGCRSTTPVTAPGRPRSARGARSATGSCGARVDWLVVSACVLFAFLNLHPAEILDSVVPVGRRHGRPRVGARVPPRPPAHRGPASGWTPDWYAGFPAYQFYMVVPSLLIVALDVGLFGGWLMIVPLDRGGGLVYAEHRASRDGDGGRAVAAAVIVVVLGVELPYGTAFKLVTVLGVLSLPMCGLGVRQAGRAALSRAGPAVGASVSSCSTASSRSTAATSRRRWPASSPSRSASSLAMLYLGVLIRGLRDRASTAGWPRCCSPSGACAT